MESMESSGTLEADLASERAMNQMMMIMMEKFLPLIIVMFSLFFTYSFVLNVGLWRSASNYTGAGIWRILVKILVVLFFISLPFYAFSIYQFISLYQKMGAGGMIDFG